MPRGRKFRTDYPPHLVADKRCTRCGQVKPGREFTLRKKQSGEIGLYSWCRACTTEALPPYVHKCPPTITAEGKRCSKCKIVKPLAEYSLRKNRKTGVASRCRVCQAERPSRAKLPKRAGPTVAEQRAERRRLRLLQAPPPGFKRCPRCEATYPLSFFGQKQSPKTKPPYCLACRRAYEKERLDGIHREVTVTEKVCRICKQLKPATDFTGSRSNRDGLQSLCVACTSEQSARYAQEHPEQRSAYRKAHAAECLAACRRYQLRKRGVTVEDAEKIKAFYKYVQTARRIRCYWCRQYVPKEERNVDHIIPLKPDGVHAPWNLCCACKRCNVRKSAKDPAEFGPTHQGELRLLPERRLS